jgi:TPR repeat protein
MRALMCVVLVAWSGAVMAQDIVQANAAFAAKDYPKAMSLYSALAASNNAEAQLRLGEMYWYGEGAPLDRSKADALFAKAAAAGNKEAAADLQLTAQRAQKTAAIAYWTSNYHGEDLTEGKFACTPLAVPQLSKTTEEVKDLSARAEAWRNCYTGFVANIGDAMPPGKRIPEDVTIVMSEAELQQAKSHLDRTYNEVLQREKSKSLVTVAELDKWQANTAAYMKKMDGRSAEYRQALDDAQRMHDQGASRTINTGHR